jgi:hypothetical protein
MSLVDALVHEAEAVGLSFGIKGEHVVVRFPVSRRAELAPLIDTLKRYKHEVEKLVRNRPAWHAEADWPSASLDAERRFAQPDSRSPMNRSPLLERFLPSSLA